MGIQEILRDKLCAPLAAVGATDPVTGTDLRRFADNLSVVLAESCSVCVTGTVDEVGPEVEHEDVSTETVEESEPELQPGKVAAAEAAEESTEE